MKNILKAASLAIALFAGVALAPRAASAQTLTVDTDTIFSQSEAGKSGANQLKGKYDDKLKAAQAALDAAVKDWNAKVTAAQKIAKPNTPLPPETEKGLNESRQNLSDAKADADALRSEIQYIEQYIRSQIVDVLLPVTEKIRADRKANVVLARGAVLAFDPAFDVTQLALQELNKKITTVSITPPQPGAAPAAGAAAPAAGAATPAKPQPVTR